MSWNAATILKLGRVSNLPTVWSNTLAGVVLAGVSPFNWNILTVLFAMTLAYVGGMFLNDAFDCKIDAIERPERPIPSGELKTAEVFAAGFTLLAGAILFTALAALGWGSSVPTAAFFALLLCAAIVLYNAWHKNNPISPIIMGLCRMLVYFSAAFAATSSPDKLIYIGALILLAYLIGLTYVAKQENLGEVKNLWPVACIAVPGLFGIYAATTNTLVWPALILFIAWIIFCLYLVTRKNKGDIPKAVVSMIAGIALVDAILITATGSLLALSFAIAAFLLTLYLQRYISGT